MRGRKHQSIFLSEGADHHMPERTHRVLESLSKKIEELETRFNAAYWDSQVEASAENDGARVEIELELRALKGDPANLDQVEAMLARSVHDPLIRRQLEILKLVLTGEQMSDAERAEVVRISTAIESEFASYRPTIDGERWDDNRIDVALTKSHDSDHRKRVWYASKEIGGLVSDRVRELARVRNTVARNLGFDDFYRMELELQEIEEDWLFRVMDDLEQLTGTPFKAWKTDLDEGLAERFGTGDLRPWHYADPFFQELPPDSKLDLDALFTRASAEELAKRTFDAWDIDLEAVLASSDLYPRDRKCQHAFCISVDRKDDVRVLANVVPGERWASVMLHECGHAAYDISIDRSLPYLLREPAHIFVTEAIALLAGRFARDPEWLTGIAAFDREEVASIASDLARTTAAQSLLFTRWGLVMVHFERELYRDPEADLDQRWWELVERFQLVTPPEEVPQGGWASKIHVAVAPVYYQNYLLGDMLASQLAATAQKEYGGVAGSKDAGRFLSKKVFEPGSSLRWDHLVEAATGSPLGASAFAEYLTAV
jgi:peptidyl-dipeptidase A